MIKLQIQTDIKENAFDIIKTAISAEIKRLEIGLNKTNRNIEKFEKKYNISSDTFLRELSAEDMKHGDYEYVRWAGEIKIRNRILIDLKSLMDIEYVA